MKNCEPLLFRGVGHREHARAVVFEVLVKLVFEGIARPAGTGAFGASGLNHEVGDHAMELQSVIKTLAGELFEIGHRLWGLVGVQLQTNDPAAGGNDGDFHTSPFLRS